MVVGELPGAGGRGGVCARSDLRLHVALVGQQLVVLDEVGVERAAAALRLVQQPRALHRRPAAQRHAARHWSTRTVNAAPSPASAAAVARLPLAATFM